MARIVVSGATGFLGGQTVRHLQRSGHAVTGLGRAPQALAALERDGIAALRFDLAEDAVEAAQSLAAADVFVHCAALSAPWGPPAAFHRANVAGTAKAIALAQALGVRRFVNISSPSIYFAPRDQTEVVETHPLPRPVNAYARSKAAAEALVLACPAIGPVTLRPRGIYGAGDTALLPRLLAAARRGPLPLLRGGRAAIDLTHVTDVVRAIEAAIVAGDAVTGESFNISGGEVLPIRQIVEQCCTAAGQSLRWQPMPWRPLMALAGMTAAVQAVLRPGHEPGITPYGVGLFAFRQSLDISKAARLLRWTPALSFAEGLERTFSTGPQP